MSNDRDDQLNSGAPGDETFSVEEILAEYGVGLREGPSPDLPWIKPGREVPAPPENIVPFPSPPAQGLSPGAEDDALLPSAPGLFDDEAAPPQADKVVDFPPEESPIQAGIGHLKRKADAYADTMFAEEGSEVSDETKRIERLVPGVDEEQLPPAPSHRERKPRQRPQSPPDVSSSDLAARFGKGLGMLRLRAVLVFLLSLPLLYLALSPLLGLPLPGSLAASFPLQVFSSGFLFALAMVLGIDAIVLGVVRLFLLKPGADTLVALACILTLTDAFTQLRLMPGRETLPFCAAAALALFFNLWGNYADRQALRLSCRTAASAKEPYIVTLDEGAWNGKDAYSKWSTPICGFGSQAQEEDGVQMAYRYAAPLLLLAAVLFSLLASVGRGISEQFIWCLSAMLTASASFSGLLIFSRPFRALARRLALSGAAIPGWSGASRAGTAILLTDADLFPPGSVSLNGIKIFGDFPVEKVVGITATLLRDSGHGLEKLFHDLLRAQGAAYRRAEALNRHEGGGLSAVIRDQRILVGSASFMSLMEIGLPQGLNVRNAVFCAIDGELAGIFALNYTLQGAIPPALSALISGKIAPVLATRDFNLFPAMLRQKFKLPVEKMDFPAVERRAQLSSPNRPHSPRITAVLCREGLAPFADAVVGARRLRGAVRWATGINLLGSVIGLLLSFYLCFVSAYAALSPAHLTVFLAAWLVPTLLISGWVNRY